jgi:glycosyltransferase involved in cell wall biosynthesis
MKLLFLLPQNVIGGGVLTVYNHSKFLNENGYTVDISYIDYVEGRDKYLLKEYNLVYKPFNEIQKDKFYDVVFATWWETLYEIIKIPSNYYFYYIQDDERRFYEENSSAKINLCELTYLFPNVGKIVVANWLKELLISFNKDQYIKVCPNGFESEYFYPSQAKNQNDKLKILIEGPGKVWFKRINSCFEAIKDIEGIEVWFVSRDGFVDENWKIDKYFENVARTQMGDIYRSCDVLLKMSEVESFCLPNLEMMACGGTIVTTNFTGHEEYAVNNENSIVIPINDINKAKEAIIRLTKDISLLDSLKKNAIIKSKEMNWNIQSRKFKDSLEDLLNDFDNVAFENTKREIQNISLIKSELENLVEENKSVFHKYNNLFKQHHRIEYSIFRFLGKKIYKIPVLNNILKFLLLKISKRRNAHY